MKVYHVSQNYREDKTVELSPKIPMSRTTNECAETPRICVSDSVENCLTAIMAKIDENADEERYIDWVEHYCETSCDCEWSPEYCTVYETEVDYDKLYEPTIKEVPDIELMIEWWLTEKTTFKKVGDIKLDFHRDMFDWV